MKQIWVGKDGSHIERREIVAVSNRSDRGWHKPQYGTGLWTSTWDETGGGWVQWALGECYDLPKDGWNSYLLQPASDARVYEIDDYADLQRLVDRYPMNDPTLPHRRYPDWEAVAEDYDGVHLTDDGQWATRLSHPLDLYGWDCESTLWFRWVFDRVEALGRRDFALSD